MITRDSIASAYALVRPHIRRTPVIAANEADFGLDPIALTFKLELLQHAGAFKTRGAFANLLMRQVPTAGVVAASGGNHEVAVAYAAMKLGREDFRAHDLVTGQDRTHPRLRRRRGRHLSLYVISDEGIPHDASCLRVSAIFYACRNEIDINDQGLGTRKVVPFGERRPA
jgi:Pyridoxal-phosphate dependent enzyme